MLTVILLAAAILLVGLLLLAAFRPAPFRYTRSIHVKAPPAAIFAEVDNLRRWEAWSPFDKADLHMKRTYEGPAAGTGSSYAWDGNRQVGTGRATIVESRPAELIRIRLEFLRPFACVNTAEFTFQGRDAGTDVSWSLYGNNLFIGRLMGLFMSMDRMVGGQFEKGLADLKAIAESASGPAGSGSS